MGGSSMMASPFAGSRPKLLGEYLREQAGLTSRQVVQGLRQQVMARDQGEAKLLGEILVDLGYVSSGDVAAATRRQLAESRRGC